MSCSWEKKSTDACAGGRDEKFASATKTYVDWASRGRRILQLAPKTCLPAAPLAPSDRYDRHRRAVLRQEGAAVRHERPRNRDEDDRQRGGVTEDRRAELAAIVA